MPQLSLTPYEIIDITETVSSIGIGFSDVMRIDIETTSVTLSGPDGEAIVVTLEEGLWFSVSSSIRAIRTEWHV